MALSPQAGGPHVMRSALAVVLAAAAAVGVGVRLLAPGAETGGFRFAIAVAATLGAAILTWLLFRRLVWTGDEYESAPVPRTALLVIAATGLIVAAFPPRSDLGAWSGHRDGVAVALQRVDHATWGERRAGFELHAAAPGGYAGTWRATVRLPATLRYGGTARVWVTQPEWAVFDDAGEVHQGADGVRVTFLSQRGAGPGTLSQLDLHLHANPDQRRWHPVDLRLPRGSREVVVEVTPGPPGSNDWFDRVWVSPGPVHAPLDRALGFAIGLTAGLLVWLLGTGFLATLRPPYTGRRGVRALVAVNVAAVILLFAAAEASLRLAGVRPYARTHPGQIHNLRTAETWAREDARFGWVVASDHDPSIDAHGFRNPAGAALDTTRTDLCRVMLLGDSFAFGSGVAVEDNLASRLQAILGPEYGVLNFGVPGWGIDQMFLAYRAFEPSVDPDLVVLAYIDDDVGRVLEAFRANEGRNKPSFRVRNGQLVPRPPMSAVGRVANVLSGSSAVLGSAARNLHLYRDARPVVRHIMETIAAESAEAGRRFVVVRIPTEDDDARGLRARRALVNVARMVDATGTATYLEAGPALRSVSGWPDGMYLRGDGHLSPLGNRIVAAEIARVATGGGEAAVTGGAAPGSCRRPAAQRRRSS